MRLLLKLLFRLLLLLITFSLLLTLAFRWIDPPITFLMARDHLAGVDVQREWVPLSRISPHVQRAAIGAEDSGFCTHHGLDLDAIKQAYAENQSGERMRGGSTISQQTAKNVFLWPGRTMVRKGLEAWFTLWIELLWGKARIMEVYLNVIELGQGIYGVEAAARHYFGKDAQGLSRTEAARLAAILPQPLKRDAGNPGPYTRRYAGQIMKRADIVARDRLDACIGK